MRFQKYPDTCGRGLNLTFSKHAAPLYISNMEIGSHWHIKPVTSQETKSTK